MLPHRIAFSAMISSPTERGVVLIGGHMRCSNDTSERGCCKSLIAHYCTFGGTYPEFSQELSSKKMIELSGNSVSTLKWTILEQTLDHGGIETIAIPISQDVYNNLVKLSQESLLCFNDPIPPPNGNYPPLISKSQCFLFLMMMICLFGCLFPIAFFTIVSLLCLCPEW